MTRGGRFITFEGPEGSGKTTQMRLAVERLRNEGVNVVATQEPGGTDIGRSIRRIVLDAKNQALCARAELLLYFAARAQNTHELILPALARGATVVSDRFTDSTLAYQGTARGLGKDVVLELHKVACGDLWPDITIVIDIDPDTGLQRAQARNQTSVGANENRFEEESRAFHEQVRSAYFDLSRAHPERIKLIDGRADPSTVAQRVWEAICG
jgi:dTMP kinase